MPVRRIKAIDQIESDRNSVALQRGPLVYCFEHSDMGKQNMNFILPDTADIHAECNPGLLDGVVVLKTNVPALSVSDNGLSVSAKNLPVMAIPYYSWANRGEGSMKVWVPRTIGDIKIIP